ncbi:methylenetetrahydrofolate reductase [Deinococcus radiophilus]|uniref:Methylenetetrahydrofolate reductase n=1 Tax=Deinococcus radiophilus TaxID=32062 RepID=A0A3S0I505_9DEIO|nr:methylenetetrahydrofolate reductase [Deinococcus radiophilus]RTR25279.1 methylenetetrahydrofolate reductase [Deinococcus radiophilus]UFA51462.1 methylenetetrahydrofolate reductase [Deinococcus radiophilus]
MTHIPHISVELVPRTRQSIEAELQQLKALWPGITTVNVPDLDHLELGSCESCALPGAQGLTRIPHLRSSRVDVSDLGRLLRRLDELELTEVLVVRGDPPKDGRPVHDTSSVELIRALKAARPDLKVHAALDPYRQSLQDEQLYALKKIEAGAASLFTQPLFDTRLMEVFGEMLPGVPIYWGITNVSTERSKAYWVTRNRAVFPKSFEPTLEWCTAFAREAVQHAQETHSHLYFMPIRTELRDFLGAVIPPAGGGTDPEGQGESGAVNGVLADQSGRQASAFG